MRKTPIPYFILWLTIFLVPNVNALFAQPVHDEAATFRKIESLIQKRENGKALELLEPLVEKDNPHVQVKALRLAGTAQLIEQNYEEADRHLERALELSRAVFNRYEEAMSLYYLARIGTSSRNFEDAKTKLKNAASIARMIRDKELQFRIQNIMTWTYYETGESFYDILEQESEVYHLAKQVGNRSQKANVYNNLGYDLTVAGTVPVDSAISLMKFANDTYAELEGHQGRWYTLMNLTWQHRLKNDLENAIKYGEKSLNQALAEEDRHAIVEAAFQLGESLMEMGEMEKAKTQYEIGLEWRGEEKDRDRYVFDAYFARFLWESGERQRAISLLETAVEWLIQSEVFYEMHGRALLASYYWELGQTNSAAEQLEIIENPRGDYISLESRCIGATVRAKWFAQNDQPQMGRALMESWLEHTRNIGAQQLVLDIENNLEVI